MTLANENPNNIFSLIQIKLSKAVKNRFHGFHIPVFSNLTHNNSVNSRVVVLRNFDPKKLIINFHTDFRSKKINEIIKNPNTFFLFYDYKDKMQLRINTKSFINHKNNITKKSWDMTKLSSRKCYLAKQSPGSKSNFPDDGIPKHLIGINPHEKESQAGYENFVVIENKIKNIEWLYLSSSGHRRLFIDFNNNKIKHQWLIP